MAQHYVCKGSCGGVAPHPGTCQNPECEEHGNELQPCDCSDPEHTSKLSPTQEEGGAEA